MKIKPVLLAMIGVGLVGIAIGVIAVLLVRGNSVDERLVRNTLRANPEIILEALQTLQDRRAAMGRSQQRDAVVANRAALLEDANSFVGGNPKGDVTIVEFFDYRCPYCRQSMAIVDELIKSDPGLRLVYKEYPVLGPQSLIAARLAVAARRDARYEALHAALMTAPSPLDEEQVLRIAADLGLDADKLASAMNEPEIEDILRANHALARQLGISGTPAFVIGDTVIPGLTPLADLKRIVADVRARGGDRALGRSGG